MNLRMDDASVTSEKGGTEMDLRMDDVIVTS